MKRVLIVDDSMIMRFVLTTHLKGLPIEIVAEATNGREALELFSKHKPDIVTMDIMMPEMDGLTSMKKMIQILPETKVIVVTAVSDPAVALDAMEKGAYAVIHKPVTAAQMQEIMSTLV
ncbi:MAG TPA: response regulator [Leptospiraceae bacterium]|nr:response regulator [Leptospiraceae bacterium]